MNLPKEPNSLRIGTVKFLNAKPLDYGFLWNQNTDPYSPLRSYQFSVIEDTPAKLIEYLLNKKIDIGLISSVEYLRHKDKLRCYPHLGICARKQVKSIFLITKHIIHETNYTNNKRKKVIKKILLDNSSRSSIALLKILYYKTFGELPYLVLEKPGNIIKNIDSHTAGLLIGDSAIHLYLNPDSLFLTDLAEWWFQLTELPFVFALWCFPKELSFDENIFEFSYQLGIQSISSIIRKYPFPEEFSFSYLTNHLYYRIQEKELQSLQLFETYFKEMDSIEW